MIAIVLHDIQRKAGSLNRGSLPLGFLLALIGSEKERNDLCAGAAIVRPEQAITNAVCDSVLHRPYALSADETSPALAAPRHAITALFSCRFKCPCSPRRQRYFHGNADRAYNTLHFATQSRVPRGKPLWKPLTTKQAEYPALSRCLILSLYLLSAAPVSRSAFCVLVHNVSVYIPTCR